LTLQIIWRIHTEGGQETNLGDTFLVLSSVENCPCYSARILPLEEERFGLSILEAENLAISPDIELTLCREVRECKPLDHLGGDTNSLADGSGWGHESCQELTLPG
jgi:hypothetical protein